MASGSVDQKNTYVFAVVSQSIRESVAKTLSYWSTGNGDDTMVTLWNPADEAQDFVFTLFFSGGHYLFPLHLGPRATQMFNLSEIIHSQIPDSEGNTVPLTIHEGSAEISGTQGENEHILIGMNAGIYNVQKATCGIVCTICHGAVNSWVAANPFGVPYGGTNQLTYTVQYHSGHQYDRTSLSSWTSSDSTIATVNSGLVTAVSAGTVQMTANDSDEPDYWYGCSGEIQDCPVTVGQSGGSSGQVVTVIIDSFTPNPVLAGGTANVHITVNPSAAITLTISSTGTGTATFGTSGSTTTTIPETTTVNITGGSLSSNGSVDLTLSASYQGTVLDSTKFSVTSGACTASYAGSGGDGQKNCPSQVNVFDNYNLVQFCPTCKFSCLAISYDSTFTPDPNTPCTATTGGLQGSGNVTLNVSQRGTFAASDCNFHNLQIQTTVTSAQGVITSMHGGELGLKCNKSPNGSPCP